jgi:hypothetical protein
LFEEPLAASGGGHGQVAVWSASQQFGADVCLQALDLQVEVAGVKTEGLGGGVHAGVGHHLLEPAEALPAAALSFDGPANVFGQVRVVQIGDNVAGGTC